MASSKDHPFFSEQVPFITTMQDETGDDWIYTGQDEVPETVRGVTIAENMARIPDEAFQEHQELEEVTISSSVQVIGRYAFYGCKKLKSILYRARRTIKSSLAMQGGLFVVYPHIHGIPSNVKVIDDGAFHECKLLERLGLNEGLELIGKIAFARCESLTEVSIPSTVKVVDDGAFQKCKLLKPLGLNEGLERIGVYAFFGCESLTEVSIPSTVKVIDNGAFNGCNLLGRIYLNEGIERIGEYAFFGCECLKGIDIPSTVKVIDDYAFYRCKLLERLGLNEGLERIGKESFADCESLTEVHIPSTVNEMCVGAFEKCKKLVKATMHQRLENRKSQAFCGCDSLTGFRILSTNDRGCCIICMDNEKSHAVVPCGHLVFCDDCAVQAASAPSNRSMCPICRKEVVMVIRIFGL
eukprot:scaffold6774_cov91-Cylindrotheca_fusiformis.AAC.6